MLVSMANRTERERDDSDSHDGAANVDEGNSQPQNEIIWTVGEQCQTKWSGDEKLYTGIIRKLKHAEDGKVVALIKFAGYDSEDNEEVDLQLLQKSVSEKNNQKAEEKTEELNESTEVSGWFRPFTGNESISRLEDKYGHESDSESDIKSSGDDWISPTPYQTKGKVSDWKIRSPPKSIISSQKSVVKSGTSMHRNGVKAKRNLNSGQKNVPGLASSQQRKNMQAANERDAVARKTSDATSVDARASDCLPESKAVSHVDDSTVAFVTEDGLFEGFGVDDLEKPRFSFSAPSDKIPFILDDGNKTQVPATLNQYLRDYQREGVQFLYSHYIHNRGAILGDDMGLGKTVQVIAFISALMGKQGTRLDVMRKKPRFIRLMSDTPGLRDEKTCRPFLIIGPGSVLYNWLEELDTWAHLSVRKYHGVDKVSCLAEVLRGKVEVVVTTFETCRDNINALNEVEWEAVIVDEVHRIKGLKARTTHALRSLKCVRRFGLTGTALQNNMSELWCILDWAQPHVFGSAEEFEENFVHPIELGQKQHATKRELAEARQKKEEFAKVRSLMLLRRTKKLIADQLPVKTDRVVFCQLTQLQVDVYKAVLSHPDVLTVLCSDEDCVCGSGRTRGRCCFKKLPGGRSPKSVMFSFMHVLLKTANHIALLIPHARMNADQVQQARKLCDIAFKDHPEFVSLTRNAAFRTLSDPKYCGKMKAFNEMDKTAELHIIKRHSMDSFVLQNKAKHEALKSAANHTGPVDHSEILCSIYTVLTVLHGMLSVFAKSHSKVLVFSYSTRLLDILEQHIISEGYVYRRIDGTIAGRRRQQIVREFNSDPDIFLCLISTKAGGLGLNMTGANRVVIFDPNWNPSHDLQAQDRAYRIGQRRDVEVFRLISAGSIEENIYLRQIYKQQLDNVAIGTENARRYFKGIQGDTDNKGELFGVKNMFQLRTGDSCLTMDILNRHAKVEAGIAGFEVADYIPSWREQQQTEEGTATGEDSEEENVGDLAASSEEESLEAFRELFPVSDAEAKELQPEVPGRRQQPINSSEPEPSTSRPNPDNSSETKPSTSKSYANNSSEIKPSTSKSYANNSSEIKPSTSKSYANNSSETKPSTSKSYANNSSEIKPSTSKSYANNSRKTKPSTSRPYAHNSSKTKPSTSRPYADIISTTTAIKRKLPVDLCELDDSAEDNMTQLYEKCKAQVRGGKDADSNRVSVGRTLDFLEDDAGRKERGRTTRRKQQKSVEKSYKAASDLVGTASGQLETEDSLATPTFSSIRSVFEQCGVIHVHENPNVIGASKVEDHITRCALHDVFDLNANTQTAALLCDPMSQPIAEVGQNEKTTLSSKRGTRSRTLSKDHNTPRTISHNRWHILVGQTPTAIRKKQWSRLKELKCSGSDFTLAQQVAQATPEKRLAMLKEMYRLEMESSVHGVLEDILTKPEDPAPKEKAGTRIQEKSSVVRGKPAAQRHKTKAQKKISNPKGRPVKKFARRKQVAHGLLYDDFDDSQPSQFPEKHPKIYVNDYSSDDSVFDIGSKISSSKSVMTPKKRTCRTLPGRISKQSDSSTTQFDRTMEMTVSKSLLPKKVPEKVNENLHDILCSFAAEDIDELLNEMGRKQRNANHCPEDRTDQRQCLAIAKAIPDQRIMQSPDESKKAVNKCSSADEKLNLNFLDDIFSQSLEQNKRQRKPPPSRGQKLKTDKAVDRNQRDTKFKAAVSSSMSGQTCSRKPTSPDMVSALMDNSTLLDDEVDCFDKHSQWKKRKKVWKAPAQKIDRLIQESTDDYRKLFESGRLIRKQQKDNRSVREPIEAQCTDTREAGRAQSSTAYSSESLFS